MSLAICSLASSSSGNCYVVRTQTTAILVDAGISNKQIRTGLEELGLQVSDLSGILITHEHSDHIKGLETLTKKEDVSTFASQGTAATLQMTRSDLLKAFHPGDVFCLGDIEVHSFSVSHDAADPVGYSFCSGGETISVVTDTGIITEEMIPFIENADILVLESNHDVNVLRMGRYPWFLKQRILGDHGHLSNESAAYALAEILKEEAAAGHLKNRIVLLAHLSKENNFPEMALATMENILLENGITAGKETKIIPLDRVTMSPVYSCR